VRDATFFVQVDIHACVRSILTNSENSQHVSRCEDIMTWYQWRIGGRGGLVRGHGTHHCWRTEAV